MRRTLVSARIFIQILYGSRQWLRNKILRRWAYLLVIVFSVPPLPGGEDLRNDLPLPPLLISQLCDFLCDFLLIIVMIKYSGAILRAGIWALSVGCCGVVHFVEELQELAIGNLLGIIGHLKSFCVCARGLSALFLTYNIEKAGKEKHTTSATWANRTIAGILYISANISHSGVVETLSFKCFPEHMLNTPKTSCRYSRCRGAFWHIDAATCYRV